MANDGGGPRGAFGVARRAGLLEPGLVMAMMASYAAWGSTAATVYAAAAARRPLRTAVIDDHGSLTYAQLHLRTDRVARALRERGIRRSSTVGLLCRNHRGFVEANVAAAKLGARVVYLNTGLPAEQLRQVAAREELDLVVHDRDLTEVVRAAGIARPLLAAPEDDHGWSFPGLEPGRRLWLPPGPRRAAEPVILTSGTTGVPKGARRRARSSDAAGAAGLLAAIPYRAGDAMVIPAPLFHAWGLSQHLLAASLMGTVVLRRRFDASQVLDDALAHDADAVAAVPVMLTRILECESRVRLRHVRIVATSGAPLPGDLATRWMDRHGDNLFNVYGSTEVGQVTIASPADLRDAPGTAGRAPAGVEVRILGGDDRVLPPGELGEIVVSSSFHFDGYTGGGSKPLRDGAMVTGDTGYLDEAGRLFVTGRVDDMIISGGENVYPGGIEQVLLQHPAVTDVAVVGVPDRDLGQRVRAVVVVGDPEVGQAELRAHAKAHLASYEVPRELVVVDELPRNATGKVLRRQLAELR